MKIVLILFLCSYASGTCMTPHQWSGKFDDMYECMMKGYEKSSEKLTKIGREEVNKEGLFVRFTCIEEPKIDT